VEEGHLAGVEREAVWHGAGPVLARCHCGSGCISLGDDVNLEDDGITLRDDNVVGGRGRVLGGGQWCAGEASVWVSL